MNTNDLYIEYARVIEMCKGTALENEPWKCVRWRAKNDCLCNYPDCYFVFICFSDRYIVESAVAVLEDKPVFVGDEIYYKCDGEQVKVVNYVEGDVHLLHEDGKTRTYHPPFLRDDFTWTPPATKRTFTLNDDELPCPVDRDTGVWTGRIFDRTFNFDTFKDKELVRDSFIKLLTEARDK